ncbi:MAG TPA: ABC transporter permease [Pseudonocardia sp.]|uniref:ABC transporter permease n=1 Tax=Pseudonocardia sp. TaxID=60912 RepID=UPI002CB4E839|nr:ABC transporter permease [Pseudonocardia sp.]HTF46448.1 ABC transporter permease [Pseudonocardia sp.]
MSIQEAFKVALRGLRANRLRSVLTMLGIMIGVAAVILLVALGNGTSARLNEQITSLGTNLIGVLQSRGSVATSGKTQPLTDKDVKALQQDTQGPRFSSVTPVKQASAVLAFQNSLWRTSIVGSSREYLTAFHRTMAAGNFYTDGDVNTSNRVAVLGPKPVERLFGGRSVDALGQTIRIGRQSFQVVGVLVPNGLNDDIAVMPISATRNYLVGGGDTVDQIVVEATSQATVPPTMNKITRILMDRHKVHDPDQKDFEVRSNLELLRQYTQVSDVLTLFLFIIAAISLFVGGIGIMNIMLVTVTERTREIGIRKAVGARRKAILKQFLIESVVLAGVGGLIGVVVGVGLSLLGKTLGASFGQFAPPELSAGSVVLAFTVSLCVGLFFGAYPANRAARMRPIDALRYE